MDNRQHLLLARAITYPLGDSRDLSPPGCVYDDIAGAWRRPGSDYLLVDDPDPDPPRPPVTKKMDLETGEDQKGE